MFLPIYLFFRTFTKTNSKKSLFSSGKKRSVDSEPVRIIVPLTVTNNFVWLFN